MKKKLIHNLIILDESGSMLSIKDLIISGFNETVETIKGSQKKFPDQEHLVSFLSFNSMEKKLIHYAEPVVALKKINQKIYRPNATTPLLDALGFAINKVRVDLPKKDYHVLVTILTDGLENASREYSWDAIKKMIEELKRQNWTFTYIGTDHDLEYISAGLAIDHTLYFDKNEEGVKNMFMKEQAARRAFYANIDKGKEDEEEYSF